MSGLSTAAILSLGATALSTGMGVIGQISQQQAQQQAASANAAQAIYQSQVAAQNKMLMDQRAADANRRGQVAEENRRRLMQQHLGQQTARLAAQGTDLEGSPLDILGDTRAAGELDGLTIRANAAREAYGDQAQGLGHSNQSVLESARAANSVYTPNYLGAGGSLLAGASALAERWKPFQNNNLASTANGNIGTGSGWTY